jgi:NADP-dependent 3-hydroxy acid dehydrogenase YdfG
MLEKKTVLITGGASGIGKAIAQRFAKEGTQVIITGRNEDRLKNACDTINTKKKVQYFVADVSDRVQIKALINWIQAEFGQLHILVNNAGVNICERELRNLSSEQWDYLINVNATGAFNLIYAVLPHMRTSALSR